MRITKLLTCVCCLIISQSVWGQAAHSPSKPGILGYLDPNTGAFRPVPLASDQADAAAAAALPIFGGTITVTLTITVKSTTLTNFTCTADVTVLDALTTGGRTFDESATAAATGTGTTRTCKLTIPYSWSLATQSSDSMMTSYTVFGTTGTTGLPQRTSTLSPLDTRKVPANGVITALTAAVTL
jgi:hypothetical protein